MKKLACCLVLVVVSSAAFAGSLGKAVVGGVVGGAVAGVVVNSVSNSKQSPTNTVQANGVLLTSTRHTITCVSDTGYDCHYFHAKSAKNLTPAQFAGAAGYKALWKVSTMITPDHVYLVLEVSK